MKNRFQPWSQILIQHIGFLACCFVGMPSCLPDHPNRAWISHQEESDTAYGVFHYKRVFDLEEVPETMVIHVSADNRYKLFLNGHMLGLGPARGSLEHWNYESYDLGTHLKPGTNVLSSTVWNAGEERPLAQISCRTAFCLFAEEQRYHHLNTGTGNWWVKQNKAYNPINFGIFVAGGYYVCGPGDSVVMEDFPTDLHEAANWQAGWKRPMVIPPSHIRWILEKRSIPLLESSEEEPPVIVRLTGFDNDDHEKLRFPLSVPAGRQVSLLLDQGYLTVDYPALGFSGGNNARIRITYGEALYDQKGRKGNRSEIDGKQIRGYYDVVVPDGKDNQRFIPLWLRTFRYIQLDIETTGQTLELSGLTNSFSAYPLSLDAVFKTDEPLLAKIMETGWRTLRLCAGETYFDCPYYEQLQYAGDTRVQMLITYALSSDDRLARNAMLQLWHSMLPEGITLSRYPSLQDQKIPGFSLYWISMVYDYLMYRDDPEFLEQFLPAVERVLDYFRQFVNDKDLLGPMDHGKMIGGLPEYWYFCDWSRGFERGIPQGIYDNSSSIVTLHYIYTLQQAARIMDYFGKAEQSTNYLTLAGKLQQGVMEHCYDSTRGLIAQTPDKEVFSQHANVLGILTDTYQPVFQANIIQDMLDDETLIRCSMYYQFYLRAALVKAGWATSTWRCWMTGTGHLNWDLQPSQKRNGIHVPTAMPGTPVRAGNYFHASLEFNRQARDLKRFPSGHNLESFQRSMPLCLIRMDLSGWTWLRIRQAMFPEPLKFRKGLPVLLKAWKNVSIW